MRALALLLLVTVLFLPLLPVAAQTFVRSYPGPDDERALGVVQMPDGGFLVVGTVEVRGAVGAGLDAKGVCACTGVQQSGLSLVSDPVIAELIRTDSFGFPIWMRFVIDSTSETRLWAVTFSGPDTILVVGDRKGQRIDRDMYAAALDSSGNVRWSRSWGSDGFEDIATAVCAATDGAWLVVGHTLEFGQPDVKLTMLDSVGNLVRSRVLRTAEADYACAVSRAANRGYAVAGTRSLSGSRYTDGLLLQLNDTCGVVRTRMFGGGLWDEFRALVLLPDSGFALVGFSISDSTAADIFVQFTDSTGQGTRHRRYGQMGSERGSAVAALSDGLIIAGESFADDSSGDACLLRIDFSGAVCWERSDGGDGFDCFNAVRALPDRGVVAAGQCAVGGNRPSGFDMLLVRTDEWGTIGLCADVRPAPTPRVTVWPNPFTTELRFGGRSNVWVHAADGRVVRVLELSDRWDGKDETGRAAPFGVYFIEMPGNGVVKAVKQPPLPASAGGGFRGMRR